MMFFVLSSTACLASVLFHGYVEDLATGEPIIGAAVLNKGHLGGGSITDMDGRFAIYADYGDVLQISCVGYVTYELKVSLLTTLYIHLKPYVEPWEGLSQYSSSMESAWIRKENKPYLSA